MSQLRVAKPALVQCFTLSGTSKGVFSALAVLLILAIPPGIAAVCALPGQKYPSFYGCQQAQNTAA
jgi:hypothetical protein